MTERRRILLVEDSEFGGQTVALVLRSYGHQVEWVRNGHDARIAASSRPQVIIVDRGLPDCDGVGLAAELRDLLAPSPVRVVVLSGEPRPESSPVDGWLEKPVSNQELLRAIGGAAPVDP